MNVRFVCPECSQQGECSFDGPIDWECPHCDHRLTLAPQTDGLLPNCTVCGNLELYRKKDFPHWLGMLLLVFACLAFLVTNYLYQQWLAWGILLGSALIDCLLYLAMGDVIVCYRCDAHHRGFSPNPAHGPYQLSSGERYRQERLRREQVQAERKNSG